MSLRSMLVVSLGNPAELRNTYHSAGHIVLEALQRALGREQPPFVPSRIGRETALVSVGARFALLQSPAIMNVSGPWVARAYREHLSDRGLAPSEVGFVLVHDDLEEELGVVRIRDWKRSHRGHNGVKSVNGALHADPAGKWARVSIGIGRPDARDKRTVSNFVLSRVPRHERSILEGSGSRGLFDALVELERRWGGTSSRLLNLFEADWNNSAEAAVEQLDKATPGPLIYAASKAAAEKALWAYRDEHKPKFTIMSINPCFVAGPALVSPAMFWEINKTNRFIPEVYSGMPLEKAGRNGVMVRYVDVRDVARLVVFAVNHPDVADGERYLLASHHSPAQAVADLLREAYPERASVIYRGSPGEGYFPDYRFPPDGTVYDRSKAVRATGQDYIPWPKTVLDTAESVKHLFP
ncbi:hypothetical protein VTH06DRAFT_6785 [Thermothelomyces fergusii]